ncbi:probable methyltransferase PMT10 [Impatiens glandulifera]|uniref:probable methyltransferase PMT10 n=1 Tax=Impatiens glandulifera TaxID=253017 RepID=UPI001FB17AD3|nr:probable methyltransferase PMT10 [Impatiens glandulifera]
MIQMQFTLPMFPPQAMKSTMKSSPDFIPAPSSTQLAAFSLVSLSLLFIGLLFSDSFLQNMQPDFSPSTNASPTIPPSQSRLPPPQPVAIERMGIIDEYGVMTSDFVVGEFEELLLEKGESEKPKRDWEEQRKPRVMKVGKYRVCDWRMVNYIPCLDYEKGGMKEWRHCPEAKESLNCVVPRPEGYKLRIPWPQSRNEIWASNVANTSMLEEKFTFPFHEEETQYFDQISKVVPRIAFGLRTRVALDIGSVGMASFGLYMLDHNVTTLTIAPKDGNDTHYIQFALERGLPAMVVPLSTQYRFQFPSQAFDLIHSSARHISWTLDDGTLLLEVNRILRAGGYFVWAAQPTNDNNETLDQLKEMVEFTELICWKIMKKENNIIIWQKPFNNSCYLDRDQSIQPPLCDVNDDPDNSWYVKVKPCLSRLPENGSGSNISYWPARLHGPPDRLMSIKMDAYISRKDLLNADSIYWNDIASGYVSVFHWKDNLKVRNVMDMKAGYGSFAAALYDLGVDCWVMNVVPVSGSNTLPVIYDRGLIGVRHDWCEPFDTYPRTYDILNAADLFSMEEKRCDITEIMLEMDRILRPGGRVFIRDTMPIIKELTEIANAIGWVVMEFETGDGPHGRWKLLFCEKRL